MSGRPRAGAGDGPPVPVVYVRFNSNAQFTVEVTSRTCVADIKAAVASHHKVKPDTIKMIFAGHELSDDKTLEDCHIETQSILHAVTNMTGFQLVLPEAAPGLTSIAAQKDPDATDSGAATAQSPTSPTPVVKRQAKYYVYCKEEGCRGLSEGKLRVRCSLCKDGAFVLTQEPSCWADVKVKERIHGRCGRQGCNGNIAEFFFKCARHRGKDREGNCIVLDLLQYNTYAVPCITCDAVPTNAVMVFPCDNSHVMCLECFHTYATTKLNDRTFRLARGGGYSINCPCPGAACDQAYIEEIHHFRLLGDDQYERYQKFGTEEVILQMGGVMCPSSRCGNPICLEHTARRIDCPYCKHVFCKECKENFHNGSCPDAAIPAPPPAAVARSQFTVSEERADNAALSRQIIKEQCKRCPKCGAQTEKNGGCMHMSCPCGFQWCWLCSVEWGQGCQANHWFGPRG